MNFLDHAVKNMPFLFSLDVKVPMNYVHNNEKKFGFPPMPIMMQNPANHHRSKTSIRNPSFVSPVQKNSVKIIPSLKSSKIQPSKSEKNLSEIVVSQDFDEKSNHMNEEIIESEKRFSQKFNKQPSSSQDEYKMRESKKDENLDEFILDEMINKADFISYYPEQNDEDLTNFNKSLKNLNGPEKYNKSLYDLNEALFNNVESKKERLKTQKFIMKALGHELNKLESHVTKSEKEIQNRQKEVDKIDADMKIMNQDLKKFLYEREANALIKRIDETLKKPIQTFDSQSNIKSSEDKRVTHLIQDNENLFHEISQFQADNPIDSLPSQSFLDESQLSMLSPQSIVEEEKKTNRVVDKRNKIKKSQDADLLLTKANYLLRQIKNNNNNKKIVGTVTGKLARNEGKSLETNKENQMKKVNENILENRKAPKKVEYRAIKTRC